MTSAPLPDRRSNQLESEAAARVGGLFVRHGRMVYGVCRAMLRDVHEAEDAAQQVFLSAHKALLGGARVRDSGRWLATIARNECRGRIAAGMRAPLPVSDEDLAAIPSTVDEQARHDQALEFREALAALPERQREAVVLRYLFGLRYGEVATALGLSRPATEALLFRARRGLRGRLRTVVGTVLVVPLALREELAMAIPGFSAGAATLGVAGGLLAKLTAAPVGVKVATAAVAVSTVGAVGTIDSDRPARSEPATAPIVRNSTGATSDDQEARSGERRSGADRDEATGDESAEEYRSGQGGREDATDEAERDRAGSSSGSGSGRPRADDDSQTGSTSAEDSGSSGSGQGIDATPEADSTDSSDSSSGGSDDDGTSSGSSDSGSGSSGSGSGSSGSSGSGSEDPSDDEEP